MMSLDSVFQPSPQLTGRGSENNGRVILIVRKEYMPGQNPNGSNYQSKDSIKRSTTVFDTNSDLKDIKKAVKSGNLDNIKIRSEKNELENDSPSQNQSSPEKNNDEGNDPCPNCGF